jgi:DNA-binding MarR family transcriptional regulator
MVAPRHLSNNFTSEVTVSADHFTRKVKTLDLTSLVKYSRGVREAPELGWLDPEEQRTWLEFAYATIQLQAALDSQLQRDADICQFEFQVMVILSMAPERTMRLSELGELTASGLSKLSNAMTRLERRGFVRREPDPTDGRYTLGVLTKAGWDKVAEAAPPHVGEIRRLVLDPLTQAQQQQLRRICQRILHAVQPDKPPVEERLRALQTD